MLFHIPGVTRSKTGDAVALARRGSHQRFQQTERQINEQKCTALDYFVPALYLPVSSWKDTLWTVAL